MRHLEIRNFGPVQYADIELGQVNIIIGMQSSGKSCVLKIACHCAWVEKRLELAQKTNGFEKGSAFIDLLASYYNMTGYIREDTYIGYETTHLKFHYDHSARTFSMQWKTSRWNYKRPKISYVPADRNLVAAIPGWSTLSLDENMLEFMASWDRARRFLKREDDFLGLGMTYLYDTMSNMDKIQLDNGQPLMLKEGSSGLQSLLPMYVHMDYLTEGQYDDDDSRSSYEQKEERRHLLSTIYSSLYKKKQQIPYEEIVSAEGLDYGFSEHRHAKRFREIYGKFVKTDHSEIFLEEPEDNLFPPTQCQFVNWILEALKKHNDLLFIATHSPYILNQVLKNSPDSLAVFFTHRSTVDRRKYCIRQLTEYEVREVYDDGVDMFFNFELYV